jgi:hypothetical protein
MTDEMMPPERAARLLRAKAHELEHMFTGMLDTTKAHGQLDQVDLSTRLTYIVADVALLAQLVADYIERLGELAERVERLEQLRTGALALRAAERAAEKEEEGQ